MSSLKGSERNRGKPCKDCGKPKGPAYADQIRCYRCTQARKHAVRKAAHGRRVKSVYGITGEEYDQLYEAQGERCAICPRARGITRRLAVDHDHAVEAEQGSRASVRGLLCGPCNDMLAHVRDDPEVLAKAIEYLRNPPARAVLDLSA
ncbi:endonuclease VII domain-containing protein [Plantactinospora sp. WMMB782]|uniref:endonuclease VII domain-containing protein n=1 Tax=Plantactinospora sp. WMMB782 TaxID=3404121 RepID=UPI003B941763